MAGGGVGLALTPLNTAAMNAIRRIEHGAAAGVLVTMSGIGATFGVALSGSFFQSVQENKSEELLSKLGIGLTEAQEQTLSGLLAGNAEAIAELRTFPPGQQVAIKHRTRAGFHRRPRRGHVAVPGRRRRRDDPGSDRHAALGSDSG